MNIQQGLLGVMGSLLSCSIAIAGNKGLINALGPVILMVLD